jgi:hypothetical protein
VSMSALTTAIFSKLAGTSLETDIGGRLFKSRAPEGTPYPYVVYFVVADVAAPVFAHLGEEVLVQFSLFSSQASSVEIEQIFDDLRAVYDLATLSITGSTQIQMERQTTGPCILEDHTTGEGTAEVWHYPVEYRIRTVET